MAALAGLVAVLAPSGVHSGRRAEALLERGHHVVVGHVDHWHSLELHGGPVDLRDRQELSVLHPDPKHRVHLGVAEFLVKARAPVSPELRQSLDDLCPAGLHVAARGAWVALCEPEQAKKVTELPTVAFVMAVDDDLSWRWKVSHNIGGTSSDWRSDEIHLKVAPWAEGRADLVAASVRETLTGAGIGAAVHRDGPVIVVRRTADTPNWATRVAEASTLPSRGHHSRDVEWCEHPHVYTIHNRWVRGIMQTADWSGGDVNVTAVEVDESATEPFGFLDGKGHIVGVADTGIDNDHCFFADDKHAVPFRTSSGRHINKDHRKIVMYDMQDLGAASKQDTRDGGHGTHIVGTILGKPKPGTTATTKIGNVSVPVQRYHGLCPEAKVAFLDLGRTLGDSESVALPNDLVGTLFRVHHDVGARVHSESWGGSRNMYSGHTSAVDRFLSEQPENVVAFASGNEADLACESSPQQVLCDKHTAIGPSIGKNVIGVGASMGAQPSWEAMGEGNFLLFVKPPEQQPKHFILYKGFFGPENPKMLQHEKLAMFSPENGCRGTHSPDAGQLLNGPELKGKIGIVMRGECFFTVKVQEAERAGAHGVIVINNVAGDPIIMGTKEGQDPDIKIPAFMISDKDGAVLLDLMSKHGDALLASFQKSDAADPHKDPDNLSCFSSRGPADDLRFKPDVVAVGEYVHSARSDGNLNSHNCDVYPAMGTSMATPQVAALSLKVRQWFLDGYYPNGEQQDSSKRSHVGGALVKAVVVQAAVPLTGRVDRNARGDWEELGDTPSFYQGHGRVQLNSTLGYPGHPLSMFATDAFNAATHSHHSFCVRYGGEAHGFRATLAWYDPPVATGSRFHVANDLDLVVTTPGGKVFRGNAKGAQVRDSINNVEKVLIYGAEPGDYVVSVVGTNVPHGPQNFAVVASGAELDECPSTCPGQSPCSGHGQCTSGLCKCDGGWHDADCSRVAPFLRSPGPVQSNSVITLDEWGYGVWAVYAPGLKQIQATVTRTDGESDMRIFIGAGSVPDYRHYQAKDPECGGSCINRNSLSAAYSPPTAAHDVYYVVVQSGCCHEAKFTLSISWAPVSSVPSTWTDPTDAPSKASAAPSSGSNSAAPGTSSPQQSTGSSAPDTGSPTRGTESPTTHAPLPVLASPGVDTKVTFRDLAVLLMIAAAGVAGCAVPWLCRGSRGSDGSRPLPAQELGVKQSGTVV